ncbi:MAG TPA: hypothetical protein VGR90_04580 [Acidimicrobiales bacterium]|nr:hypothetical protein [Acidimicrobiales bacterium]
MTTAEQRIASVVRQVCAIAAIVFGALTQAVGALHLSPAVSAVLVAAGGAVLAIEHYVSDPSTGSTLPTPPPPPQGTPAAKTAPGATTAHVGP